MHKNNYGGPWIADLLISGAWSVPTIFPTYLLAIKRNRHCKSAFLSGSIQCQRVLAYIRKVVQTGGLPVSFSWLAACLIFLTGCCTRLLSSSLDLLLMTVAAITVRNNTRRLEQTQLNGSISLHVAIKSGPTFHYLDHTGPPAPMPMLVYSMWFIYRTKNCNYTTFKRQPHSW